MIEILLTLALAGCPADVVAERDTVDTLTETMYIDTWASLGIYAGELDGGYFMGVSDVGLFAADTNIYRLLFTSSLLSKIVDSSNILVVTCSLYVETGEASGTDSLLIMAVGEDWDMCSDDTCVVNWTNRKVDSTWTTEGGDPETPSSDESVLIPTDGNWVVFTVTALTKSIIAGSRFGYLLMTNEVTVDDIVRLYVMADLIAGYEGATPPCSPAHIPRLTVTYINN